VYSVSVSLERGDDEEALLAAGRAAWPGLAVADGTWRAFVASRLPFEAARAGDLYLACACATGDAAALAAFATAYDAHIAAIIGRTVSGETLRDEARQSLRQHLFVAAPGDTPKIASYAGRGDLLAFVRVTAVRVTLMLVRREKLHDDGDALDELPADRDDPELAYLKELYRGEFKESFRAATEALDKRARTLLRMSLIDGLSIDKIGAVYGVHRSTVARQLADARAALVKETHRALMARLKVDRGEVESILRLIESQVDVSVRRLLT
jgi:RNA polymerase sigma-70 factor, ECF subfamily